MPTPYDGPERRMYADAQRRLALTWTNELIQVAAANPEVWLREKVITYIRGYYADTPDAPIVERMIAAALCARVSPVTTKES